MHILNSFVDTNVSIFPYLVMSISDSKMKFFVRRFRYCDIAVSLTQLRDTKIATQYIVQRRQVFFMTDLAPSLNLGPDYMRRAGSVYRDEIFCFHALGTTKQKILAR